MARAARIMPGYKATSVQDLVTEIKERQPHVTEEQIDTVFKVGLPKLWDEYQIVKAGLIFNRGRVYMTEDQLFDFATGLIESYQDLFGNHPQFVSQTFVFGDTGFVFNKNEKGYFLQCLIKPREEKEDQ